MQAGLKTMQKEYKKINIDKVGETITILFAEVHRVKKFCLNLRNLAIF